MSRKRLSMRKTKEILRLKHELCLTNRQIARSCGISPTTVSTFLERAAQAGLGWPLPEDIDEERLEGVLFCAERARCVPKRAFPPMEYMHKELRRRERVTLMLLWEEYRREYPEGYSYTQFCDYYRRWEKLQEPCMRQVHVAGEKMFVDWAGQTIPLGESKAHLFVAVLGASNYTYAEAFESTRLYYWIEAHIHAVEYFQGSTRIWVPDNEKTGVTRPCRYDPDLHETYRALAEHYGAVVIPARPGKARDKAKVESGVLNAERRILAAIRNMSFLGVVELNRAIWERLRDLNNRGFQKMAGSRVELFEEIERPALQPLPECRYEFAQWPKPPRVNIDYHVAVDNHFYSVPHGLVGQEVDVRLTGHTVEIFHQGERVASHMRSFERGRATTLSEHMPKSHQKHLEWTPSRLINWAEKEVGNECKKVVTSILESKPHPEMGYRACLGIIRLARGYGRDRMEAACRRALALQTCNYRSIKSILKTKLDRQPLPEAEVVSRTALKIHGNLRGREYYQQSAQRSVSS